MAATEQIRIQYVADTSGLDAAATKLQNTSQQTDKLLANINKVGAIMASAFAVQQLAAFTKEVVKITAEFQKFEAVLTNTLGSRSVALQNLINIQKFAAQTPFSVQELTNSFVKLANQGFTPTIGELRKLGDLSASTGKSFDQLVEAILDAQTGQFVRLKEFGIKASKEGDKVRFSFKGVETQVAFTNAAITEYLLSLGNLSGVSGSMVAISSTLEGRLSNLGDNFDALKVKIGTQLNPVFVFFIQKASDAIDAATKFVDTLGGLGEAIKRNRAAFAIVLTILTPLVALLNMLAIRTGIATVRLIANTVATKSATAANILLRNELVRLIAQYIAINTRLVAVRAATLAYTIATNAANLATRVFNGTMALFNIRIAGTLVTWNLFIARMAAYPAVAKAVELANNRVGVSMKLLSGGIVAIVAALGAAALAAKAYAASLDEVTDAAENVKNATKAVADETTGTINQFGALIDRLNDTKAEENRAELIKQINALVEQQVEDVNLQNRLQLRLNATTQDVKNFQEDIGNALRKQTAEKQRQAFIQDQTNKKIELEKQLRENLGENADKTLATLDKMTKLKFQIDRPQNLEREIKTVQDRIEDATTQLERGRLGVGMSETMKGLEQIVKVENERLKVLLKEQEVLKTDPSQQNKALKEYQKLLGATANEAVTVADAFRLWLGAIGVTNESSISLLQQLNQINENLNENGVVTRATIADVLTYDKTLKATSDGGAAKFNIKLDEMKTKLEGNIQPIIDNVEALKRLVVELQRAEQQRAIEIEVEVNRTMRNDDQTNFFTDAEMEKQALEAQHKLAELQRQNALADAKETAQKLRKQALEDLETQARDQREAITERIIQLEAEKVEIANNDKKSAAEKAAFTATANAEISRLQAKHAAYEIGKGSEYNAEVERIEAAHKLNLLQVQETYEAQRVALEKKANDESDLLRRQQFNKQRDELLKAQAELQDRLNAIIIAGQSAGGNLLERRMQGLKLQFEESKRQIEKGIKEEQDAWRNLFTPEQIKQERATFDITGERGDFLKGELTIERKAFVERLRILNEFLEEEKKLNEEAQAEAIQALIERRQAIFDALRAGTEDMAKIIELANSVMNNPNLSVGASVQGRNIQLAIAGSQQIANAIISQEEFLFRFKNTIRAKELQAEIDNANRILEVKRAFYEKTKTLYGADSAEAEAAKQEVITAEQNANAKQEQYATEQQKFRKAQVQSLLELGQTTVNIVGGVIAEAYQNEINRLDGMIDAQQRRIDFIQNALDQGGEAAKRYSGEQIAAEKERLEKLEALKRADIQKQQAFALIQMILNTGIAVTQAAAQGGVAAPITIAITLASLVAGLVAARAAANGAAQSLPQAEEGGIVGRGKLVNVAKGGVLSGKRHSQGGILIEAEDGERIFDRQTSSRYKSLFDDIAANRFAPQSVKVSEEFGTKQVINNHILRVDKLEKTTAQMSDEIRALRRDIRKGGMGGGVIVDGDGIRNATRREIEREAYLKKKFGK